MIGWILCRCGFHDVGWPKGTTGIVTYECHRCFQIVEGATLWDLDSPHKIYKTPDRAKVALPRILPMAYRFGRKAS